MRRIKPPKRNPLLIPVCLLGVIAGGLAGFTSDQGRIETGLKVAGIEVGGLTPPEAEQRLTTAWQEHPLTGRTFAYRDQTWEVAASKLGLAYDIPRSVHQAYRLTRPGSRWERLRARIRVRHDQPNLPLYVKYDEAAARNVLNQLKRQIDRRPLSARLKLLDNAQIVILPDRPGWAMNVEASLDNLRASDHLPLPDPVLLQVEDREAPLKTEELRPIDTILSRFTTDLAHGYYGTVRRNRTHNVRLAASKFDGTILRPGEVFSFNQLVGPRTARYGYRLAPVFTLISGANEVRDEVGGGICQCATTVYNAALLANLKILERRPHSKIVHYAQAGRDATVYFGLSDLRFRNTLAHPVAVFGRVWGFKFTVTIVGSHEDKVKVDLRVIRKAGSYHLIRLVKREGVPISQELVNKTVYNWKEKPKPPLPPPTSPGPAVGEVQPETKVSPLPMDSLPAPPSVSSSPGEPLEEAEPRPDEGTSATSGG